MAALHSDDQNLQTVLTRAVMDNIAFSIQPGEVVGFLGPNGAGNTTTLKMLSGLLFPTTGKAEVLGFEPSRRQKQFLQQITPPPSGGNGQGGVEVYSRKCLP